MRTTYCLFIFGGILLIMFSGCMTGQGTQNSSVDASPVMDVSIPENEKFVISVNKFEDRSIGTNDYRPWKMGIPDMIMEALAAVPYFKVISREYVQQQVLDEQKYQLLGLTDEKSTVELGMLLNAEYIISGSFSVMQDFLQVNAQCLSVQTGEIVSQANCHGPVSDFFVIQNTIAVELSNNMDVYISEEAEIELLQRADTRVVEASLANYEGEEKLEEIALLEKKGEKKAAEQVKEEAKEDFERALEFDKDYEKAKKNLSQLAMAIPLTL